MVNRVVKRGKSPISSGSVTWGGEKYTKHKMRRWLPLEHTEWNIIRGMESTRIDSSGHLSSRQKLLGNYQPLWQNLTQAQGKTREDEELYYPIHGIVEVIRAPSVNRRRSAHKTATHISVDLVIVLFRVDVTCHTSRVTVTRHNVCCI